MKRRIHRSGTQQEVVVDSQQRKPIPQSGQKSSFTLIELLVVIAIIALLAGLLFPAMSKARDLAHATYCKNSLRNIGVALQSYVIDNQQYMPVAAQMPSLNLNTDPRFCDVLMDYAENPKLFLCPKDPEQKYFNSEGSSYEYNSSLGGRVAGKDFLTSKFGGTKTILVFDYDTFHGPAGTKGAKNYLFADGHVGDIK